MSYSEKEVIQVLVADIVKDGCTRLKSSPLCKFGQNANKNLFIK